MKKRTVETTETIIHDSLGREAHLFDGANGPALIWDMSTSEGIPDDEDEFKHYFDKPDYDKMPEVCNECGGGWPECESGCRLFRE